MAQQSAPATSQRVENDNDDETELIDRLRSTALGGTLDEKSRRSAQLAFDPEVDLEKRMRHIAGLTDTERPRPSSKKEGRRGLGWLPIPLGVLAVITLGAAIARNTTDGQESTSKPGDELETAKPATSKVSNDENKKPTSSDQLQRTSSDQPQPALQHDSSKEEPSLGSSRAKPQ